DALNSGRVDGASLLVQLAMGAKEKGIPLKTVALGHTDGNVIVSSKNIKSPKDLKGKTFAIPHKMSSHNILLKQMLKKNNMKIEDLKIIELAPPEMPAALSEGRIDAYAVAEPFGAKAVASDKGKVLLRSDDVWENSVCCALALREDFINKNKDTAQTFMNNYVKAGKIASQDKEKTAEIVSKYLKVDEKVLDLSLGWIKYDNLKITEEHYNLLKDYMVEYGISKNPPAFKDMVDNSLIDNVK
ncbi:MAG: ABC transporter substrate-binding protein, partial [Clostridium sp.]